MFTMNPANWAYTYTFPGTYLEDVELHTGARDMTLRDKKK